ncbi:MAG: sulfotransferase [Acetobacteraceae bacterium]|nr:sulfotransferase [Acetobacteraceae bacterium]
MIGTGPVFVVGCPRSGTSALSWALASHPDYWTSVETHFFYNLLRDQWLSNAYEASYRAGSWLDAQAISIDAFFAYAGMGFDRLMRSRSEGLHWVDSSPENLMVARPLLRMFGEARIFHVVRDPQSVCLSMLTSGFTEPWAADIGEAIQVWKHYVSVGLDLAEDFPDRVAWIKQEDMCAAAAAVASEIGSRLGLEDATPIETFLNQERINSSADKTTYVDDSPFRHATTPSRDSDWFQAMHGARVQDETAPLAARFGYGRQ